MSEQMIGLLEISIAVVAGLIATYQYYKEKKDLTNS